MNVGILSSAESDSKSTTASSCSPVDKSDTMKARLNKLYEMAYCADDVPLCEKFADACCIGEDSATSRRMIVRLVRMLHLCDYTAESIELQLAVALAHLSRVYAACDPRMDDTERTCIAVMQCYNAHCYLEDEACPLKYWQQAMFANYCNVKVLNSASLKLLRVLKFNMSVQPEVVQAKLALLR